MIRFFSKSYFEKLYLNYVNPMHVDLNSKAQQFQRLYLFWENGFNN